MAAAQAFDVYQLSDEHQAVREAVREVCAAKVTPHAAEADETGEFPKASYDALRAADFHAPHIPVEYGGAGADALATAIVIEEVARGLCLLLADSGGQQAGHHAVDPGRLRGAQAHVPHAGGGR